MKYLIEAIIENFPEVVAISKIAMALLLSSLIGIERETTDKPIGLRGTMLVTLGTVLFAIIGLTFINQMNLDMIRLLYAPIIGIGFLGSGVIIMKKGQAQGITTATVLWAMVGIGLLVGLGMNVLAIVSTLAVYGILKSKTLEEKIL